MSVNAVEISRAPIAQRIATRSVNNGSTSQVLATDIDHGSNESGLMESDDSQEFNRIFGGDHGYVSESNHELTVSGQKEKETQGA